MSLRFVALASAVLLAAPLSAQPSLTTFGGTGSDFGYRVTVDGSGNSVVTGRFFGTVDFDPSAATATRTSSGSSDVFVARYSAAGALVSVLTFGGTGADVGYGIALDGSGNSVVTGQFFGTVDFDPGAGTTTRTSGGRSDVFVARYTAAGALVSVVTFGGTDGDVAHDLVIDASGNSVVTGYFVGTTDFDPGAGTTSRTSRGSQDVFVARYTAAGALISVLTIGGTEADVGQGVAVDGAGSSVVMGTFNDTVDFDPGAGTASHTSAGSSDVYVARYSAAGELVSVVTFGNTSGDVGSGLTLDASGNSVVTGQFSVSVDFDPSEGTASRTSVGSSDVFVVRYNTAGALVSVGDAVAADGLSHVDATDLRVSSVMPNPSRDVARLSLAVGQPQRVRINLYDVLGRRVASVFDGAVPAGATETVTVETAGLPAGVYVVRVEGTHSAVTRALVMAQ